MSNIKTDARFVVMVDFGSTYTKLAVADRQEQKIVTTAKFPSTVATDASIALMQCYEAAKAAIGEDNFSGAYKMASSSAAGGLRMGVCGLSKSLSLEAGKCAAFGAGAKILTTQYGRLTEEKIAEIEKLPIEILLITGGYNHGGTAAVLHNVEMIAASDLHMPIVFAGNSDVAGDVRRIMMIARKECYIVPNIIPDVGQVDSESVEEIIRNLFLKRIINMKGLSTVEKYLDSIVMPTPKAVLSAGRLLSEGPAGEEGLGELMIVDIGGATTDIHSYGSQRSFEGAKVIGTPEPYAKRTVEGDLGMRESSDTLLSEAGVKKGLRETGLTEDEIGVIIDHWHDIHEALPANEKEAAVDEFLAQSAVHLSARRHAGLLKRTAMSDIKFVQLGKNLTDVKRIIGTGGPLVFGGKGLKLLQNALKNPEKEMEILLPVDAEVLLDNNYVFFAAGLLGEIDEAAAFKIMCDSLGIK